MPLLSWLRLPNKSQLGTTTDGLPSSLNVWLILGKVCVCVSEREREREEEKAHRGVSHPSCIQCAVVPGECPHSPWAHPCLPDSSGNHWMNGSAATSVHTHQTCRCNWVLGWCEQAWAQSIYPPYCHPAPVCTFSHLLSQQMRRGISTVVGESEKSLWWFWFELQGYHTAQ